MCIKSQILDIKAFKEAMAAQPSVTDCSTQRLVPSLKFSLYLKYHHDGKAEEEEHEMAFSSRRIDAYKWVKGRNSFWDQLPTNTISMKPETFQRKRKRSKMSMQFRN